MAYTAPIAVIDINADKTTLQKNVAQFVKDTLAQYDGMFGTMPITDTFKNNRTIEAIREYSVKYAGAETGKAWQTLASNGPEIASFYSKSGLDKSLGEGLVGYAANVEASKQWFNQKTQVSFWENVLSVLTSFPALIVGGAGLSSVGGLAGAGETFSSLEGTGASVSASEALAAGTIAGDAGTAGVTTGSVVASDISAGGVLGTGVAAADLTAATGAVGTAYSISKGDLRPVGDMLGIDPATQGDLNDLKNIIPSSQPANLGPFPPATIPTTGSIGMAEPLDLFPLAIAALGAALIFTMKGRLA